jgi:hypothetical protein
MRLCRHPYKGRDGKTRESAECYVEVMDHEGRRRRILEFTHKGATAELGRSVERLVSLRAVKHPPTPELSAWLEVMPATFTRQLAKWGLLDQRNVPHGKSLLEHLEDFRKSLVKNGRTEMHADIVAARVRNVFCGYGFACFSHVSTSALSDFRRTCRQSGLPKPVKRPRLASGRTRRSLPVRAASGARAVECNGGDRATAPRPIWKCSWLSS